MKRIALILIAVLLVTSVGAHAGKGRGNNGDAQAGCNLRSQLAEIPPSHLGDRERTDLRFMREEEKLARDVYLSLHERWELAMFRQIARAESRHMALTRVMIHKYGVEDPVGDNGLGVFTNSSLQALYEELTASGAASVEAALLVGAAIEELDIRDLKRSLERSNNRDLALLYQNLMKGSRNHLRAFTRALERRGLGYEPVYLSAEEYQEIVESPRERGVVGTDGQVICGGGSGW